ncbi:hypothetical protein AMTRI_Chr11g96180 [Amborella trichopoda]
MKLMINCHHIVDIFANLILSMNGGHIELYSTPDHSLALNNLRICQRYKKSHFKKPNIFRNPKSLA